MELYVLNISMVFNNVICQSQADCIDDKGLGCLIKPELLEVF